MFASNFRRKFLYQVSRELNEKSYGPDEMIFRYQDDSDHSIYFITSGKVDIFYDRCEVSLQKLGKGRTFGGLGFFSNCPRTASAKSLEFTTVFYLKRELFLQKLEQYPIENETYRMIFDSISLQLPEAYQYLDLRCYSCGHKNHVALHCPSIHASYKRNMVIQNHLKAQ